MDGIIIIALVCLQLISFFFIVILFAKLNKFKELERKQEQIVEEMDAALGAYLMEMKEENKRLIEQLATLPKQEKLAKSKVESSIQPKLQAQVQQVPNFVSPTAASSVYKTNIEKQTQLEESAMLTPNSTVVETTKLELASTEKVAAQQDDLVQVKALSYEEMVLEMYKEGKSIEEIAKNLDKGKTEIELLLSLIHI